MKFINLNNNLIDMDNVMLMQAKENKVIVIYSDGHIDSVWHKLSKEESIKLLRDFENFYKPEIEGPKYFCLLNIFINKKNLNGIYSISAKHYPESKNSEACHRVEIRSKLVDYDLYFEDIDDVDTFVDALFKVVLK